MGPQPRLEGLEELEPGRLLVALVVSFIDQREVVCLLHFEEKGLPSKKDALLTGRRFRRVRRGAVGRNGRVCPEPAQTASGALRRTLRQAHNLK